MSEKSGGNAADGTAAEMKATGERSASKFERRVAMLQSSPAELQALYQDVILDHYRRPRNKGKLPEGVPTKRVKNPFCGDEVELALVVGGDGRVTEARFEGQGCSISQASASMLTDLAVGRTVEEVRALGVRVQEMLAGSAEAAADPALGELRALSGVSKYPARHKCATIAWDSLSSGA